MSQAGSRRAKAEHGPQATGFSIPGRRRSSHCAQTNRSANIEPTPPAPPAPSEEVPSTAPVTPTVAPGFPAPHPARTTIGDAPSGSAQVQPRVTGALSTAGAVVTADASANKAQTWTDIIESSEAEENGFIQPRRKRKRGDASTLTLDNLERLPQQELRFALLTELRETLGVIPRQP
ncbi:hypothetical protein LAZ67_4003698 [Cordylochernes scorpioides]|uniref:Uncharacterized protein n=1 Tax=Cordylochernes scorpioides TaxID=51811 RepID=A0ABY6KGY2_9ARAC|nr:hypothetical protein LAZ67_4003698 [Cordylochernes scorpioides]